MASRPGAHARGAARTCRRSRTRRSRAMQDVLQELFLPCYFLARNNLGITVAKIVENTLPPRAVDARDLRLHQLRDVPVRRGDIELGYRFGRAAVDLAERYPDKKSEPMLRNMWGAFVAALERGLRGLQGVAARRRCTPGSRPGQYIWAFYNTVNLHHEQPPARPPALRPPRRGAELPADMQARPVQLPSPGWSARSDRLAHQLSVETGARRPRSRARGSTSTR